MNELILFEKDSWKIRTTVKDGRPLFSTKDVCDVLGIGNVTDAMCRLDEDEREFDSIETLGGKQQLAFVTEAGLYSLVLGSRKPDAREFKRWVTHDILPSIRKHGMYATPATVEAMLADPDTMIKTLTALKEERAKVAVLQPKADFYDAVTASDDWISMDKVAKVLNLGYGRNTMFAKLRGLGILDGDNYPYQRYVDRGHFRLIEQQGWKDRDGNWHPTFKTLVSVCTGIDFIRRTLTKPLAAAN